MDDDREKKIQDILDGLNKDIRLPPYDQKSKGSYYSRAYKEYKEEEIEARKQTRYEKICYQAANVFHIQGGDSVHKKLTPPINLLGWDITPGMVMSATIGVFLVSFLAWFSFFMFNTLVLNNLIPTSLVILFLSVPLTATYYTYMKPVYAAKNKVIRSSGDMILAILYMVVYMRSSPNLEGAVRFAALNLEGPIAKDLKGVLWDLEVGKYNMVNEALENYTKRWKDYNDDFLESLNLLRAAMDQPNPTRQERMLQDAIDNILDGTQEKMKHYAQNLETPVMIINAMGAMLPVLAMIMLPLLSAFMGGIITPLHLFVLFNLLLPGFLWWFMQRSLSSRPPTVATKPVNNDILPDRGRYTIELLGREMRLPVWPVGVVLFLVLGAYGIFGYISFPVVYPVGNISAANIPSTFLSGGEPAPLAMLMRSVSIVFGLGMGIGVTKVLGNIERRNAEEKLQKIESQFPNALFELGNKISGGTPIELGLEEAAESTSELEISELFSMASRNVREMGMTFEDAIFDSNYGALRQFPSQMIRTVMKAILESSEKGTKMASTAMMTISRYLKNIHQTQEQLNDLMEDTTTTIQMLAYLLAPVISGVAIGMSQTLITALFQLSSSYNQTASSLPSSSMSLGGAGLLSNLNDAIPPELLQFVVGIYLIQLLHILGTFYMKITHGEDKTYKNMFTGKILISGMFFYTITLLIIGLMFGGLVDSVATI